MLRTIDLRFITKSDRLLTRFYRQKESKNCSTLFCYQKLLGNKYSRNAGRLLPSLRNSKCTVSAYRTASTYLEANYSKSAIEDASLDFACLARKYNYPVETHSVTTSDGYILQVYRLPRPEGKPVFLMHGLLDSSDTWIIPGTDIGLGYYLHDLGYDVWLGNARGNFYSRNHIKKSPEEKDFWDFSWHEIGYYDLPAMIDYVLDKTDQEQLTYFGHSQGTTVFFVMASTRTEYNSKIRLMNALAPVAYMTNASAPLEFIIRKVVYLIEDAAFEILPRTDSWKLIFSSKISENLYIKYMMTYLGAYNEMWHPALIPTIAAHAASGCSFKQIKHYAQVKDWQRFCLYDHGEEGNIKHYDSKEPPSYRLENITAPIALYYAQNDPLSNVKDVRSLIAKLPNVVDDHMYPDKQWNHVSMIWGIHARNLAHKRIVEMLEKYHQNCTL